MIFRKEPFVSKNEKCWLSEGGHITEVWSDGNEYIAIGYVGKVTDENPWFMGRDYRPFEGCWSSGVYNFRTDRQARKYMTQAYGKDLRRVDMFPERSYRDLY